MKKKTPMKKAAKKPRKVDIKKAFAYHRRKIKFPKELDNLKRLAESNFRLQFDDPYANIIIYQEKSYFEDEESKFILLAPEKGKFKLVFERDFDSESYNKKFMEEGEAWKKSNKPNNEFKYPDALPFFENPPNIPVNINFDEKFIHLILLNVNDMIFGQGRHYLIFTDLESLEKFKKSAEEEYIKSEFPFVDFMHYQVNTNHGMGKQRRL